MTRLLQPGDRVRVYRQPTTDDDFEAVGRLDRLSAAGTNGYERWWVRFLNESGTHRRTVHFRHQLEETGPRRTVFVNHDRCTTYERARALKQLQRALGCEPRSLPTFAARESSGGCINVDPHVWMFSVTGDEWEDVLQRLTEASVDLLTIKVEANR